MTGLRRAFAAPCSAAFLAAALVGAGCDQAADPGVDDAATEVDSPEPGDLPPPVDDSSVAPELVRWTHQALASRGLLDSAEQEQQSKRCDRLIAAAKSSRGVASAEELAELAYELQTELERSKKLLSFRCVRGLHTTLGVLAARESRLAEAIEHYVAASYVSSRFGDSHNWCKAQLNLAGLYFRLGRMDDALRMADLALAWLATFEPDPIVTLRRAQALTFQGRALLGQGRSAEAIQKLREGLELRHKYDLIRPAGENAGLATGFNALGRAFLDTNNLPEAEPMLRRFLDLTLDIPIWHAHALVDWAEYQVQRGDSAAAADALRRATEEAASLGLTDINFHLHRRYIHALDLELRGDLPAAIEAAQAVMAGLEAMRSGPDVELYTPFFVQRRHYVNLLVRLLLDAGRTEEAFDAAEWIRARGLLDAILWPPEVIRRSSPQEQLDRADELRVRLADLATRDGVEGEIRVAHDALLSLEGDMRRAAHVVGARPVGFEAAKSLLHDGDLLLSYWLHGERAGLWVLAGPHGTLRHVDLGSGNRLEAAALEVTQSMELGSSSRPGPRHERASLSAVLLGPVEAELAASRRVVVITDGALAAVPFAALTRPDGAPLLRRHSVVYTHSLSVLAAIRDRRFRGRPAAERMLSALVDPAYRPQDAATRPPLPASAAAAADLAGLARSAGGEARVFEGLDATRDRLLAGAAGSSRYVHIGAHVELHPTLPDLSAIHLADLDPEGHEIEGALRIQDLDRLGLTADVVTLAGCETAVGPRLGAEGPMAFPRGFLHAGADSVVASLWPVRDAPTAELMVEFYRGLMIQHLGPAESLRRAQLILMDGAWPAPEDWAGFVLLGEWKGRDTGAGQPFSVAGVYPKRGR